MGFSIISRDGLLPRRARETTGRQVELVNYKQRRVHLPVAPSSASGLCGGLCDPSSRPRAGRPRRGAEARARLAGRARSPWAPSPALSSRYLWVCCMCTSASALHLPGAGLCASPEPGDFRPRPGPGEGGLLPPRATWVPTASCLQTSHFAGMDVARKEAPPFPQFQSRQTQRLQGLPRPAGRTSPPLTSWIRLSERRGRRPPARAEGRRPRAPGPGCDGSWMLVFLGCWVMNSDLGGSPHPQNLLPRPGMDGRRRCEREDGLRTASGPGAAIFWGKAGCRRLVSLG